MTSPTLLTREILGAETFEVSRILFHTPSGGCGERKVYTVRTTGRFGDKQKLKRLVWEARREAAIALQAED